MKVQLISHSQAPDYNESALDLVAYCARVSNPSNQNNKETSEKLVKYLMKHKHWSPLEMVSACLEIETTRDIARQLLRHRSFSFQEFSQRYAVQTGFETRDARLQDPKNRQNSIELEDSENFGKGGNKSQHERLYEDWWMRQRKVINEAEKQYAWALEQGIAKEQARAVLPEGNTSSVLYMAGTLRSWIHYCQLRCANGTQKEHKVIADQCKQLIAMCYPQVYAAVWSGNV